MKSVILVAMCSVLSRAQVTPPRTVVVGGSYIGVMMQEVDSERAKALKLREAGGVEITVVEPDSPAEKGGLKVGDVVEKYNGLRVEGMQHFARMVHETPAGREVKIEISRGGIGVVVTVRVAQRKAQHFELGDGAHMP